MTTGLKSMALGPVPAGTRVRLRYGFNEDNWRHFALGSHRERIWARLQELDTRVVRVPAFDRLTPDPIAEWDLFAAHLQAVLNAGATPMVTIAKFRTPYDDPAALRRFAGQCAELVQNCLEKWGGEAVRDWYWCVGNEVNSPWSAGGLTFEQYRLIYEEVARGIARPLASFLGGRKPLIGGPAADGFQPFWFDWVWRLANEVDNSLVGFASWHWYGDWREPGAWGAPREKAVFEALLMSRAAQYEPRARAVGRALRGRGILNVCGELNAHSHHEPAVSGRFNQTAFGAAYYASALIHLIRGGADLELFCSATDDAGPYGLMDKAGEPTPAFHAKALCTRHVQPGDRVAFPAIPPGAGVQALVARGEGGRRSALLVHVKDEEASHPVSELVGGPAGYRTLLQIDRGTGNRVAERPFDGTLRFEGYGVAVVTSGTPEA